MYWCSRRYLTDPRMEAASTFTPAPSSGFDRQPLVVIISLNSQTV